MNILFQKAHQRALGTYPLKREEVVDAIGQAAAIGYRAFDTAQMYGDEADVGRAQPPVSGFP